VLVVLVITGASGSSDASGARGARGTGRGSSTYEKDLSNHSHKNHRKGQHFAISMAHKILYPASFKIADQT
jgi:hypothetical protein